MREIKKESGKAKYFGIILADHAASLTVTARMAKTKPKPLKRPFYNAMSFMRNYLAFTDRD
jgi:hypothetical protein